MPLVYQPLAVLDKARAPLKQDWIYFLTLPSFDNQNLNREAFAFDADDPRSCKLELIRTEAD